MMQMVAFYLAVLSAAHAIPLVPDQQKTEQQYPVMSSDYLSWVVGRASGMFPMVDLLMAEVDVVSRLRNQGLHKAAEIAQRINLNKILTDAGVPAKPYTLFAPNDRAFQKWKEQMKGVVFDQDAMTRLCKAWVVPKVVQQADIANEMAAQSLEAEYALRFNIYNQPLNNQNEQSQKITVNGAQIVRIGQQANNGIVHEVDRVIHPLPDGSAFEIIKKLKKFSMFVDLVKLAGIEQELKAEGVTVLAPVNEAFFLMDRQILADLMNEKSKVNLQKFIRYHTISGTWYSAGLRDGERKQAADGNLIKFNIENDKIYLNKDANDDASTKAKIVYRDIPSTNGVLHVIDRVLRPQEKTHLLNFWF